MAIGPTDATMSATCTAVVTSLLMNGSVIQNGMVVCSLLSRVRRRRYRLTNTLLVTVRSSRTFTIAVMRP